ncbi:MAG: polymorphic toxin type 23 domain-containing protein [Bacteroidia bacterium]
MRKQIPLFFLLILFLRSPVLNAQKPFYGAGGGIVFAFGTKFDRFGLFARGYIGSGQFQLNGDARFCISSKNLGPAKEYPEATVSCGVVYAYWKKDSIHQTRFLTEVSNQTGWCNSIGYGHTFYLNRIGTTQQTGTFSLEFNRFHFISENDILGHSYYDRFRTGAMLLQYMLNTNLELGLNFAMWTGQMEHRVRPVDYPYTNGYMDTTDSKFAKCSAGLLSLQVNTVLPVYDHQVQANAGIDAEQIRNVMQNRIIHDLAFLPHHWRTDRNAHMPMLDENGDQYLYKPGQKIRKPSPYLNTFVNPALFY